LVGQGWFTFQNALWGFAFGCGSGIVFGVIAARFPRTSRAIMPYAIAANAIPIIAITPIMNQWFGTNEPMSKIAVVAVLTFFTAMISTLRGLSSAPEAAVELMHSYAANEIEIFAKMRLPYALPYIFGALKVCTTVAMIGAIVAEYFGGPLQGLGVNIADNAALSKFPTVWAQIVIASVLGLAFYFVISLVERLVMPWHISFRDQID
jgi:NitT/TauT family transport system permease protein